MISKFQFINILVKRYPQDVIRIKKHLVVAELTGKYQITSVDIINFESSKSNLASTFNFEDETIDYSEMIAFKDCTE
jgi:hypothetical protein